MFGLTEFQLFAATMVVGSLFAACLFAGRQYRLNRDRLGKSCEYGYLGYAVDDPAAPWNVYRESGLACRDEPESPALRAAREKFRPESEAAKRYDRKAEVALALGAIYGTGKKRTPSIFLTPRQLERVNIQRRLDGRPPLNRAGFTNAVALAATQPIRQPDNSSEWLTYLILYECLTSEHESSRVGGTIGLTITPDAPYNGHGGEFAGAGATGNWTAPDPYTALAASAIIGDQHLGATGYCPIDPLSDPNSYQGSTDNLPSNVEPATAGNGYHFTSGPAVGQGDGGYPQSNPSDSGSNGPGPSFDSSPSFDAGTSTI